MKSKKLILISSCLIGISSSYKGKFNEKASDFFIPIMREAEKYGFIFIPVCPEQLGGLSTPREPSELLSNSEEIISGKGKILSKNGMDVTENFLRGGNEALKIADIFNIKTAIMKEKSPSCGKNNVYSGDFSGTLIKGMGITSFLLSGNGIKVYSDEEILLSCLVERMSITDLF
ncbi:MAG: DUF523 domain-containing protein [Candidatus Riflebacteria bacterium]|nr:DUF523 domain-containing protein [Candidatus Riflebacteria bacterium]